MKAFKGRGYDYLVFWGTCLGYGVFLLYLVVSFADVQSLRSRYVNRKFAFTLYMPTWNLYTASPLSQVEQLYTIKENQLSIVDIRPFTATYLFGLDRKPKIVSEETSVITRDTALLHTMQQYVITIPRHTDLSKYLSADTLHYTNVMSPNILYLKGRYVIAMEQPLTWQQARAKDTMTNIKVLAVNILQP